ncbi:hypothetical protein BDW59DRAFT_181098 [Aspergillus cavernicola]|uniref:Uncharacterized protein n=1 Tax=Aspergillus cavernicola TaxID=176166 RepID=A0ABR4I2G4_9EURO
MVDWQGYLPEWGQLPVEQYLIRSWDPASPKTAPAQRARLIQQFLQLDQLDSDWDPALFGSEPSRQPSRVPTPEEVATILRPWRSDTIRRKAWRIWCEQYNRGNPVLLRTWYDPADDERVKRWATLSKEYASDAPWAILDDSALFSFCSEWQLVYNILPEIAVPQTTYSWSINWDIDDFYPDFKDGLKDVQKDNPSWREDLDVLVKDNAAALDMLHYVSTGYIMVADNEAFETDHLLLAYLDTKGRVTMQGRIYIEGERLSQVSGDRTMAVPPVEVFEEGTLGEKYVVAARNELDRELYRWTREDLEDDPLLDDHNT